MTPITVDSPTPTTKRPSTVEEFDRLLARIEDMRERDAAYACACPEPEPLDAPEKDIRAAYATFLAPVHVAALAHKVDVGSTTAASRQDTTRDLPERQASAVLVAVVRRWGLRRRPSLRSVSAEDKVMRQVRRAVPPREPASSSSNAPTRAEHVLHLRPPSSLRKNTSTQDKAPPHRPASWEPESSARLDAPPPMRPSVSWSNAIEAVKIIPARPPSRFVKSVTRFMSPFKA
ncbi:hypothetical protein T484DRAFT_1939657 [Baffinella frigidus]|nr:hypothetical protein T484DRAFT_1939657 [Cryptophyta sp. CCMP2293]